MASKENFLVGIFDDEDVLVHAVETIRDKGVKIKEVYSPFPVHGLDEVLGYTRTRLPIAHVAAFLILSEARREQWLNCQTFIRIGSAETFRLNYSGQRYHRYEQ